MSDHKGKRIATMVNTGVMPFVGMEGVSLLASYAATLEARLEKAREVIKPFAESAKARTVYSTALDDDDHLQVRTSVASLRAARAWMEQNDG